MNNQTPTQHRPIDPWFSEIVEHKNSENYKQAMHSQLNERHQTDTDSEEMRTMEDLINYQLEVDAETHALIEKSHMGKRARANTAQIMQKQAELYRVINDLPGEALKQKISLFLALAIIQQQHPDLLNTCRQAIAESNLAALTKQLEGLYQQQGWFFTAGENMPRLTHKSPLPLINQALTHLVQHYSAEHAHISLYHDMLAFCRKFADELDLFDLHPDLKRLIHHFIDPNLLNDKFIVQDGCAGIGLLTQDITYPKGTPAKLQLETDDPLLAQIGQQLNRIQSDQTPSQIEYKMNLALDGQGAYSPGLVDVYVSFPKIPCNLKPHQREPLHAFRSVNYRGPVPNFASDAIWVQYALATLHEQGQAFVVVQDGFLRRAGYDAAVREYLVKNNLLVAVISLHREHAKQTQYSQLSLLVLNKARKTAIQKTNTETATNTDVYFYYLRNLPADLGMDSIYTSNAPYDWAMHPWIDKVTQEFYKGELETGTVDFYKTAKELEKENYNLSFEHYMAYQRTTDYPSYQQVNAEYQQSVQQLTEMLKDYSQAWK